MVSESGDVFRWPSAQIKIQKRIQVQNLGVTYMKYLPILGLVLISLAGCVTGSKLPAQECFHENEEVESDVGYCQALRDGDTLHISGVAGQGDMADAIRSVYARLGHVLQANGLSFANVVKENVYATDLDAFIRNRALRKEFYAGHLPSATWVQVQRLYLPSFVVEIELTAKYPTRSRSGSG